MFTRADIFRRAHQLRVWNRKTRNEKFDRKGFGRWLRMAWAEAKAGTLPSFAPEAVRARAIEAIKSNIVCIWNKDRLFPADYAYIRQLEADRDALLAQAA
ncbi:MAG: hypothetical protein QOJ54_3102 [Aliidongia sp.]|jgi:hypothetical protein|nr:hypothetical protein [Aliidongia sp.]